MLIKELYYNYFKKIFKLLLLFIILAQIYNIYVPNILTYNTPHIINHCTKSQCKLSDKCVGKNNIIIPKVVYFTHENFEKKKKFNHIIKCNIKHNKKFKFKFYDKHMRANFIATYFPKFYKIYIKIHPDYGAVKADIFRVLILYKYGGVYIDIKSKIHNLDKHLNKNKDMYIGTFKYEEPYVHWYNLFCKADKVNGFIASKKEGIVITKIKNEMYFRLCNFGKNILDNYRQKFVTGSLTHGRLAAWYHTGPILFTYIINQNLKYVHIINNINIITYDSNTSVFKRLYRNYKGQYHYSKNRMIN